MNNTKEMLLKAQKNHYAIPAFNVHNLESISVVVAVANELKAPIIIAFTPGTIAYSGFEYLYAIVDTANKISDVEITMHLDHHEDIEVIKKAILYGVKSVMIDASHYSFEKNVAITKEVVDFAHLHGATVEAELGILTGVEDDLVIEGTHPYTDP
ncbi:MAG: class II fructose-bisphosphate aldolase, partial [Bacilli bacterium]